MTTTVTEHVGRFVAMKQKLGYRFTRSGQVLRNFASFAEERNETFIRSGTVLEWASASTAPSRSERVSKLRAVHALACWLHAEDARHEVPPRDALGRLTKRRPSPHLVSIPDIQKLLTAALSMRPVGTIAPLTWYHFFGLIAATGLRIGEAVTLTLDDITADGLVIRDTKFGKTRMVALHSTTWDALNRYLTVRRKEKTPNRHLFVLTTGRSPHRQYATHVFRKLAEQAGIREPGAARGPTPHSLRHSFAVRSLENLAPGANPDRHVLALATYLGHVEVSSTYWYLESTPVLLRGIAEAAEQAQASRSSRR